ncbi:MAG: YebC/PmpR family DNA-binding transcriptional regulator [Desulfovibrionaceae bacterium]
MSGHSKWATIKRKKGATDAKRGKTFTKMAKAIIIAAQTGGGDPASNATLRLAISKAKAVNLPNDKIDSAIKKGTGEIEGGTIQEVLYEGYGPGGVAILVEAATDNRNRTVSEVRHALSKSGGSMGEAGCVAWMFGAIGVLSFNKEKYTEDQLLEVGLEAGVDDIRDEDDVLEVVVAPQDFQTAQAAYDEAGLEYESAEITRRAQNLVPVEANIGQRILDLVDKLEDNEDVQQVYVNADFPDELLDGE